MKHIIKKSQVITIQENGTSRFHEYQFPFKNASLGVSEINGRYPQEGYDIDEKVEQTWYVESGNATVRIGETDIIAEKGDMIYIPEGERYWINGKNLKLIVCSSPPWFPEQHKHID